MKYCKKCSHPVYREDENDYGLCLSCYYKYLLKKIDHMGEETLEPKKSNKKFFQKIKDFFKK